MKIKVKKEEIIEPLTILQSVIIEKGSFKEILSHVLIEAEDNRLMLSATNLEIGIISLCKAEVIEPGNITIAASKVSEIIKALPDKKSIINMETDSRKIKIEYDKLKIEMQGLFKEDFPQLPKVDAKKSLTISQSLLKEMIRKTHFSISKDNTRPYLCGVDFIVNKNELRIISTDGHRLSLVNRKINNKSTEAEVIIPESAIKTLMKILKSSGEAKILITDKEIFVDMENIMFISRLVQQKFPKYEHVIPKEHNHRIELYTQEFITAVNVTTPLSDNNRKIFLNFTNDNLQLKAVSEYGKGEYDIKIKYNGEPLDIAFNVDYIRDFVQSISSEKILLDVIDKKNQTVFKPSSDEGYIYVIMPMRT